MHLLLEFIARLTAPLWNFARERPWVSAGVLGAASAVCFLLGIPYIRVILALAACSVIVAYSERLYRNEKVRVAAAVE